MRKILDIGFQILSIFLLISVLIVLLSLIASLAVDGVPRLSMEFLNSFPSRFPEKAGILSAWVGSVLIMIVTASVAIPLGIAAGLYLEEYAPKNIMTTIIELSISNLAGVPSIVFGLMALGIFVYKLELGHSILTAGLTLGLLVLPIVIVSTREAVKTIPGGIREAAMALGATKWQTLWHHVIPYSMGGILTGIIISVSRAIGETAPLITIGALTFIAFLPEAPISMEFPFLSFKWLASEFTVLPIQMFNWLSRPQAEFHINAAATGVVLLILSLSLNMLAIVVRYRYRKKVRW